MRNDVLRKMSLVKLLERKEINVAREIKAFLRVDLSGDYCNTLPRCTQYADFC